MVRNGKNLFLGENNCLLLTYMYTYMKTFFHASVIKIYKFYDAIINRLYAIHIFNFKKCKQDFCHVYVYS